MDLTRRQHLKHGLGALALCSIPWPAFAQPDWPSRPVRVTVASAAAGGTDLLARLLCERLSAQFGQPFVAENKAGANGMLAAETVARSPADGYSLLFSYTAAMLINPMLHEKKGIDPLKDFEPVAQVGAAGNLLLVGPDLPVHDLKELVAYAKAGPGAQSYGSWGIGSGGHLVMESFLARTGLKMTHVPYKGTAPVTSDMLGGNLSIGWVDISSQVQHVKSGKLRAIAVSGTERLPQLPDVPTMSEQGFAFDTMAWYGLFAPARTSPEIVRRLHDAVLKALAEPEFQARMTSLNMPNPPTPTVDEFRRRIAQDSRNWAAIVQAAGVKAE